MQILLIGFSDWSFVASAKLVGNSTPTHSELATETPPSDLVVRMCNLRKELRKGCGMQNAGKQVIGL
eukprot:2901457-Amphidinium_carterae.1